MVLEHVLTQFNQENAIIQLKAQFVELEKQKAIREAELQIIIDEVQAKFDKNFVVYIVDK